MSTGILRCATCGRETRFDYEVPPDGDSLDAWYQAAWKHAERLGWAWYVGIEWCGPCEARWETEGAEAAG